MIHGGRNPIGPEDVVTIKGRYLYQGDGETRFFVKGIAFPIPPPFPQKIDIDGWIAVLEQLANDTDINAIRVYEMDCYHVNDTYDRFLQRAADLGIYVIVPLTSSEGDGNLKRDMKPPSCYPRELFHYGKTCIDNYWDRPNVLMGVIGNEVMNSVTTYQSAPCVKSYLHDLAKYSRFVASSQLSSSRKSFPLMYATQHDSPTSELFPDEAIKLTLDYLSCSHNKKSCDDNLDLVFGINIESWCSSSETFEVEDDGVTESSYHSLWRTFSSKNKTVKVVDSVTGKFSFEEVPPVSPSPVTVPVVFSEMGCSKRDFNNDNPLVLEDLKHIRDWKQIPLVSSEDGHMADLWSGFVAYAYDGGGVDVFRMMGDNTTKWNGKDTFHPSMEYNNFRHELSKVGNRTVMENSLPSSKTVETKEPTLPCEQAVAKIQKYFGLKLYSLSRMPSHFHEGSSGLRTSIDMTSAYGGSHPLFSILLLVLLLVGIFLVGKNSVGRAMTRFSGFDEKIGQSKDSNDGEKSVEDETISLQSTDMNYGTL
mmetsp:Transcript_26930/g.59142  ORF Transcript_26930/g.59142 Transcript_26930/m.59142 type:complete len:534 (-) Transcript_26930:153-1754(-)|eukprot:CAMPEP_0168167278 /NCGR_PEP_ID=MMETSP0139_2-20121125/2466_1 /TAXON_ID=44445 /ORGANISM="Pseudo-nitzschia australis, Strain 10249 10 AB" /LENGTH=533 /DNA_ID=CAMNT_0008084513 /DNA_START=105 /DNA_END=1706 /DNA_ORIENTATION=+